MRLLVKKLRPDAILPKYAFPGDAGLDIFSYEQVVLLPNEKKTIRTGIALSLPKGHVGLVWDKSGLASKNHLHTLGGVIDEAYRGELLIVLGNFSLMPFSIEKGQKIAQLLVQPVVHATIQEVPELDSTPRGEKGFGSTGLK